MTTSILPGKLDGSSDFATWLREFDTCSLANDGKEGDKIKKLPAFLRGPAASHFYAIPVDDRNVPCPPQLTLCLGNLQE